MKVQPLHIKSRLHTWVSLSILGLCGVALMGAVLRSKIVFSIPFINYNNLLEAHAHFSFGGWITPALLALLVYELLPETLSRKPIYSWLIGSVILSAWGMLFSFLFLGYSKTSIAFSIVFILLTYAFSYFFLKDIRIAGLNFSSRLMAASSIICLLISSAGVFVITYIYFNQSFDAFLYRNSLFTYLHFQYNGFFTLGVFALLFNHIRPLVSEGENKKMKRFSIALCCSIIPSLFLSYLWQDPNNGYRAAAVLGCILTLLSFYYFTALSFSVRDLFGEEKPYLRLLIFISLSAFMLKLFLQTFTLIPLIGNAIFGNRPIIMGFLHLVFLAFVTLFILAYLIKKELLNSASPLTRTAVLFFAFAVIINEALLISQGLTTMFTAGSVLFLWLLWGTGILLFIGAALIGIAKLQTKI